MYKRQVEEDDALQKASGVVDATKKFLLGGTVHKETKPIKGQTRHMLEAGYMGGDTSSITGEIAAANSAILRAVVDGAAAGVVSHRRSVLANEKGNGEQIWHRDDNAAGVVSRMNPCQNGKRCRPARPPFSAACSFQSGTMFHVCLLYTSPSPRD